MSKTDLIKKYRVPAIVILLLVLVTVGSIVAARASDSNVEREVKNEFDPVDIELEVVESGVDSPSDSGSSTKSNTITWSKNSLDSTYYADKPVEIKVLSNDDTGGSTLTAPSYIRVALVPRYVSTAAITRSDSNGSAADTSFIDFDVMTGANEYETNDSSLDIFDDLQDVSVNGTSFTNGDVTFNLAEDWNDNWFYLNGYFYYRTKVAAGKSTSRLLESVSISNTTYDTLDSYGLELEIDVLADGIQTDGGAVDKRWTDVEILTDGTLSAKD